jgi:probable F420-dependent oxidoreductase
MIKVGIIYPQIELGGDPEAVRQIGRATEDLGFDHLVAYDHVIGAEHADRVPALTGPYTDRDPFHDPFIMFAHLAAITERIGFFTGVIILPQRQTVLVARQAADVDLLSGGRLRLGVGIGWNHVEYQALGQDFHTRGRRNSEQVELLRRLWSEPLVTFNGEFDQIERASLMPKPTGRIPIWIGGSGPAAFRRAARLADGIHFAGPIEVNLRNIALVRAELDALERPHDGFGFEMTLPKGTPAELAANVRVWEEAGGTHAAVNTMYHGLDSAAAHIDLIGRVRDELGLTV